MKTPILATRWQIVDKAALEDIHARIRACQACELGKERIMAVPGEGGGVFGHPGTLESFLNGQAGQGIAGDASSDQPPPSVWSGVMCVGEAPGKNEDETGRPFCGAAGKNLDLGLAAAGLPRASVFITSINKCRPPKNRDPKPAEKAACKPFLDEQVAALQPKVLVALGRHGLSGLVENPPKTFGDVRGRFLVGPGGVPVFCSLHPAAIIYRAAWKEQYLADWEWLGAWVASGDDVPADRWA